MAGEHVAQSRWSPKREGSGHAACVRSHTICRPAARLRQIGWRDRALAVVSPRTDGLSANGEMPCFTTAIWRDARH